MIGSWFSHQGGENALSTILVDSGSYRRGGGFSVGGGTFQKDSGRTMNHGEIENNGMPIKRSVSRAP